MTKEATSTAALTAPKKPVAIQIIAPAYPAWQEMAVHVRNGYVPHPDMPIELTATGQAIISLVLGNPDQSAIDKAKESSELAIQLEQAQYERDVQAAAKALVEQQQRDALAKQVAAEVAAHEQKIKEIKAAAAKASAAL